MRKTPRTDAVWERIATDTTGEIEPDVEFSTLARELEDELNNALEKINRLEEAGDAMAIYAELGGIPLQFVGVVNAWRDAKEDKP